ncbi:hypothetical protein LJR066_003618 [Acidovorax sp. LjRoot66]
MTKALLGAPFVFAKGSHPPLPPCSHLLRRLRVVQRNLHIGVVARQALQNVRHDAEDGRAIHPHLQPPQLTARRPVRPVRRLVHHAEDGFGIAQEGLARMGQHHAARRALEELGADFGFQGLDLAGEWGLGQVKALCGTAQLAFFRYGYEIGTGGGGPLGSSSGKMLRHANVDEWLHRLENMLLPILIFALSPFLPLR